MILRIYFQIHHTSYAPYLKSHAVYNSEFISKSVHLSSTAQLANSVCCKAEMIN